MAYEKNRVVALEKKIQTELRRYDFFPIANWPLHHSKRFLSAYKGHTEWLKMFTFLWLNGMEPNTAMYFTRWWILPQHVLLDPSANRLTPKLSRDLNLMLADALKPKRSREYFRLMSYPYWDMTRNEVVTKFSSYADWLQYCNQNKINFS